MRKKQSVPPVVAIVLLCLAVALLALRQIKERSDATRTDATRTDVPADGYLFCFWNVENLFDDQLEPHPQEADREYDEWFAHDAAARQEKLAHLSQALVELNGGRGPDVLALAEVEGPRAAELLQQALNARLGEDLQYRHLIMKELSAGRHIAPAILSRLPVRGDKTQLHGRQLRILEGHIDVNGSDLVVLATHWTSRLTDKVGSQRAKYADQIYGVYKGMYLSNPGVDFLACGDFNDPPDAESVTQHLHAVADSRRLPGLAGEPLLLDLMGPKDPNLFGTHYHQHWFIFDQIVVSPGLLDGQGWKCEPDSVQTINSLIRPGDKLHRPWRFGNAKDKGERGYSDHFPVTVRLKVGAATPAE